MLAVMTSTSAAEKSVNEQKTETWYQIEVLVYEPVEHTIANESWPATLDKNQPESLIELTPFVDPAALNEATTLGPELPLNATDTETTLNPEINTVISAFQQLAPETLTLAETANKLTQTGSYRIITMQGWQQPVKQRHEAIAVHLTDKPIIPLVPNSEIVDPTVIEPQDAQSGQVLNPPVEASIDSINENITDPVDSTLDDVALIVEEEPAQIDGSVTVSLSRYLHMALNIDYYNPDVYLAEQIAQQKIDEKIIDTFKLKQSRRMRSKEVHVFDHPYFGIIATIIPVERVVPDIENEAEIILSPDETPAASLSNSTSR